ncbi:MAG: 6-phospho-beta-glucosidase [Clostridiales bacterium]|nr:6-phospho-beta-glucosidase [Clostridiales bacterium]
MKLAVIGGGGVRSLFLAKSLAQRSKELGIDELAFMDNNETKLGIYGKMARQTALLINPDIEFTLTSDARQAVENADYVITTIREGGDEMRVRDERTALSLGVLGQETTGAAGFSFAIRSVNVLKDYCELIKKYSKPGCKVFNFTNPAGVVSQTLRDMGYDFTYGICDAPTGMLSSFASLYGVSPDRLKGEVYGLNHLSYFSSIKLDGKEIMNEIIENDDSYVKTDMRYFEKDLLRERGCVLNEYLYYFYYREKALENILKAKKTRGEQILEINRSMTEELKNIDIDNDFNTALKIFEKWYGIRENNYMASETGVKRASEWTFDINKKDSGGYAGVALKFIEIEKSGKQDSMILCVPNNGAIPGLYDSDIVEITCDITKNGAVAHRFETVDEQNLELIRRVKIYERLASKAIREKSVQAAVEALTLHPLVNSYSLARELIKQYLELNRDYTKDWK